MNGKSGAAPLCTWEKRKERNGGKAVVGWIKKEKQSRGKGKNESERVSKKGSHKQQNKRGG